MIFALTLLSWFRENGRELPWRQTSDPYAIWLSEIILQQTQVKQGWEYWERFMRRWPTVEDLAAATEDEVLREWQGLGYYSRARNLHFAAKQIVALGHFPNTIEEIKKLKGVGDYTAAAIGRIAFGLPAAVVDGNVYRVLARHFGISTPINTTEGKKEFAALAQSLLPPGEASAYNQAIMDFGAIQCTPQSPRCLLLSSADGQSPRSHTLSSKVSSSAPCPLMETCVAFRSGIIDQLPVKLKTLKIKERRLQYIYIRCNGQTAIHRRGPGDIWQGLWEPYLIEGENPPRFDGILTQSKGRLTLLHEHVKHVLTHRVIYADFYLLETTVRPSLPADYIWIQESELGDYALPRLIEKLLASLE